MRASRYLAPTLKETPADADTASHQLMLRAGLIRPLAAGLYTWLPLGLRVVRKIESIVREEMDKTGAQEILMPVVQPLDLWEESGRATKYGPELLRFEDRHSRAFCLGPTHEEIVTDLIRREVQSYRALPINLYQIQTKFRDEIRPRFGVMRAREFMMKDAYSFHLEDDSFKVEYQAMYDAYTRILQRMGLEFRAVDADTGSIGGSESHEFQVIADAGEDLLAFSDTSDYAANVEKAATLPGPAAPAPTADMAKVATPDERTIDAVSAKLGVATTQTIKTLIVEGATADAPLVALILRGDHELNAIKAQNLPEVAEPLTMASPDAIRHATGTLPGSLGPVGLTLPFVVDYAAASLADFVCGANDDGYHYTGVNWGRDVALNAVADLRNVVSGDPSPDGNGHLIIKHGIETAQVFRLGTVYSEAMNANVLDENGKEQTLLMGCYGFGITRAVAAAIEQCHDDRGIVWPTTLAPFQLCIVPINYQRSDAVRGDADAIYERCRELGIEVILDDRDERPGAKFADADLIGYPHRLVISDRGLKAGTYEYKARGDAEPVNINLDDVLARLRG